MLIGMKLHFKTLGFELRLPPNKIKFLSRSNKMLRDAVAKIWNEEIRGLHCATKFSWINSYHHSLLSAVMLMISSWASWVSVQPRAWPLLHSQWVLHAFYKLLYAESERDIIAFCIYIRMSIARSKNLKLRAVAAVCAAAVRVKW